MEEEVVELEINDGSKGLLAVLRISAEISATGELKRRIGAGR
jgi:hypothetical protein